jgi:UDP-glucose 4-epimerase
MEPVARTQEKYWYRIFCNGFINSTRKISRYEIPNKIVERRPDGPDDLVAKSLYEEDLLKWKLQYSDLETILKSM